MKRVMFVTNSLTGGGAERSMNLVVNELTKRGWPIALVPINSGPTDLVIPICEVFPLQRIWRGSFLHTMRVLQSFNKIVRSWNPDILVLNCDLPELFGALLFSHRKLIVVEHADRPWFTRKWLGLAVRKILRSRKTIWVAVSSHLTIWPLKKFPHEVLLNSISVPQFAKANITRSHLDAEIKGLVYIGRLAPPKRPHWLLEIALQSGLPVEFIGEGLLLESLRKTAITSGVVATFHGQVRHPWVVTGENDLVIIPSENEGDGLIVIECLKLERPLLLADIPEFRRFELPDRNYCSSINEFAQRIDNYKLHIGELVVPRGDADKILNPREITTVGDAWEKFLNSI